MHGPTCIFWANLTPFSLKDAEAGLLGRYPQCMLTFTFAAPRAPRCSHSCACALSTFAEGAYAGSWNCDKCKTSARGERWFCQAHSEDYCFDCYPKVGQTPEPEPEPGADDSGMGGKGGKGAPPPPSGGAKGGKAGKGAPPPPPPPGAGKGGKGGKADGKAGAPPPPPPPGGAQGGKGGKAGGKGKGAPPPPPGDGKGGKGAQPPPELTAAVDPEPAAEAPAAEEPAAESVARQVVDALGEKRVLTAAEQAHFEDNRFRCPECTTAFCVLCDAAPYHLGFSCVGFSLAEGARKCRFCTATLTEHNLALDPVRSLPESAFHLRLYSNAAVIKMSYNSPAGKSSAAEARTARSRRKSSPTAARRSTALLAAASAASKRCPAAMPAEAMRVTAVPTRPAWSAALVRQRLAPAARRSTR